MVYLPPHFTESRPEVLIEHIARHDFGLLMSHGADGIIASHIPFLTDGGGENLHLHAHLARANPQVAQLSRGGEVLAVFHGPHAYISPSWYAGGPSVPTWNYADVHAYGIVRIIEDDDWLRRLLRALSQRHEARNPVPWRMQDLPETYVRSMLQGIVGLDIAVTRLEGKYKLSQNRPAADHPRVIAALEERGEAGALAVADLMREREPF
ncbi:MAG: FMN-binding negative transcriptional regulator [Alphaproteobacteria bacterium]|nr:FMN-binding negative transcriptional regulator [Alphaproteobacteria bacterium]